MPKPPFFSPPTQTPLTLPSQTTTTKNFLLSISQILQLTHHRNKNQHRLTKWYKQLCILRRNISKLLFEVGILETAEKFSGSGGGKGDKYVTDAKLVVERRVEFLENWVIEKAFVAFSTVVKDLQYSSLGLVLLATLAEIKTVIRPLGKELIDQEESDEDEVLVGDKHVIESSREDEEMQDLGEVVSREELETLPVENQADEEEEVQVKLKTPKVKKAKPKTILDLEDSPESRPKKRSKEEKKKKKRKRGDAFDDLFDSLI